MQVQAIGHAGLRLVHGHETVTVDPWFDPGGAFQSSWFQFPRNEHLVDDDLLRPAAVVITHEHFDHLDHWYLSRIPGAVPIVIPRYGSPVLRNKILRSGPHPIVELDPWTEHHITDGLTVMFVSEESPMNHDSALVVSDDTGTVLNMNDARLSTAQLRKIHSTVATIDVLALQGAGASWFPLCYDYPAERNQELSAGKRAAKFRYVEHVVATVEPTVTLPIAGPPCFLDDELRPFNVELGHEGIFPTQDQVADHLRDRGLASVDVLLPGDAWDLPTTSPVRDHEWDGFSFADRDDYIADYARDRAGNLAAMRERHPAPTSSLWSPFETYFTSLLAMSPYFNERIGMRVGFEIAGPAGGAWAVDFGGGSGSVLPEMVDCQYVYSFDGRWLPAILEREVMWEDFFLSLRFRARRDPDLYNDHLLGLLKFAEPQALDDVERYETMDRSASRFQLESEGCTYEIQQYCPHAGIDLSEAAELLPGGRIRCLGHHYEFDLSTGACLNGKSAPLATSPIATSTT